MTKHETDFGTIIVDSDPYCKGCRDFVPQARLAWVGENSNNHRYDEFGNPIYDGLVIRCAHRFMCQHIRRRMKGE